MFVRDFFVWGGKLRGGNTRGTIPRRAIDDRPYGGLGVGLQCFRPGVCCGATPSALAVSAGGRRSHRYRGQLPREGAMYGGYPCSRENFSADGFLSHRATPAVRPPGSLAAAVSAACWQRSTQSPRAAPEGVALGRSATGRRSHPRGVALGRSATTQINHPPKKLPPAFPMIQYRANISIYIPFSRLLRLKYIADLCYNLKKKEQHTS